MVTPTNSEIMLEFDDEISSYYAIWQPVAAIGLGSTRIEALEDLRSAAHFGIETRLNLKLTEIDEADSP